MTTNYTEQEFIDNCGIEKYRELEVLAYENMKRMPEFQNNEPYVHSLMAFDAYELNGNKITLIIEANAHKINFGGLKVYNFGIVGIQVSDEACPDELLDRYNELKKAMGK